MTPCDPANGVRLRRLEREDLPRMHAYRDNPAVRDWISSGISAPTSLESLTESFERWSGTDVASECWLAIICDGEFVGWCMYKVQAGVNSTAKVGIGLGEEFCGKGLGTAAMTLLLDLVFTHLGTNRVELFTSGDNSRAVRSFEKVGFQLECRQRERMYRHGRFHDVLIMGIMRDEWFARRPPSDALVF